MTDPGEKKVTELADSSARSRIQDDLETNLLVEAGAGSGKTTALIERMVALVSEGRALVNEIAAVTFTKKAANELREGFQKRLECLARDEGSDFDEIIRERLVSALDDIDQVFIGTIHAFCARLLREHPLEVGLDPTFEQIPADERVRFESEFWDRYLERLVREADPILSELSNVNLNPSHIRDLFREVVKHPDVVFPHDTVETISVVEMVDLREELEDMVKKGWELIPKEEPERGWDNLQKVIRDLHYTDEVTGWDEPDILLDALSKLCPPPEIEIVQNRWMHPELAVEFRDRVREFADKNELAKRGAEFQNAHRYRLAMRIAIRAAQEFADYRRRIGRLDYQDLLRLSAELLRRSTDARSQLGNKYRRILVDEFQDTDPLQTEILFLLTSEPSVGGEEVEGDWRRDDPRPGSLFLVGDPKQSIYRFRRADISLYSFVKDRFADFGAVLTLTMNFRSRAPITDFVNDVFGEGGLFPEKGNEKQASFQPLNTWVSDLSAADGVHWYELSKQSRNNRKLIAEEDAAHLATWINSQLTAGERVPGDFMILTRDTRQLSVYARAFEKWGLPVQVTGAGVSAEKELQELQVLLECMIDPGNPIKVVAVLVGLFFGIDYEQMLQHQEDGGHFDVMEVHSLGDPMVIGALNKLNSWWRATATSPADIFISEVISELGVLPYAAAGELGVLRAGTLVYALEIVQATTLSGDASLPGVLRALRSAFAESRVEAPLEPGRSGVIRLMNLHQAKGLEAKVVVLADPAGARARKPKLYVRREEDGTASGYLKVMRGSQTLATAPAWDDHEKIEKRFQDAEEVRLLYVAVTRAKSELWVARYPHNELSPWLKLNPLLTKLDPEDRSVTADEPEPRAELSLKKEVVERDRKAVADRLSRLAKPSFEYRSVTQIVEKDEVISEEFVATGSDEDDRKEISRGFSWGSVVHGALAAAAVDPTPELLRTTCRDLLREYQHPLDDLGEPIELTELLQAVEAVRASELWTRAQEADKMMVEVPFAVQHEGIQAVGDSESSKSRKKSASRHLTARQIDIFSTTENPKVGDEPSGEEEEALLQVIEGVVDLAFREDGGWVIADYKTDLGTDPDFSSRLKAYRQQVDLYADAWTRLTGDPVKERILFFTAQDRVESW